MKLRSFSLASVAASFAATWLSACGGGSSSAPPSPPVVASKMAAYVGVWSAPCDAHRIFSLTITELGGVKDAVTMLPKSEFYAQADCSGALLGTASHSAGYKLVHAGVQNAGVVFSEGANSVPTSIDQLSVTTPSFTYSVTGPGVVRSVKDGQAVWCIDYGSGDSMCIEDDGVQPASEPENMAMLVSAGKLYGLTPDGALYTASVPLSKR